MPANVWIPLVSASIGGLITGGLGLAGVLLVTRANRANDRERWQREQRIEAYSQLTAATHRLLLDKSVSYGERRNQLYSAYFKVCMIAGDDVLGAANGIFQLALLDEGEAEPTAERGAAVGRALTNFMKRARVELGTADAPVVVKRPPAG